MIESRLRMLAKKEQLTNDIAESGLWQSEEQMAEYLNTQKNRQKEIRSSKETNTLSERSTQPVYGGRQRINTFTIVVPNTKKRIDKPLCDIQSHLTKMINAAKSVAHSQSVQKTPDDEYLTIPLLVGKNVSHLWNTDDGSEWYTGNVINISQVPGFPSWYNITYESVQRVVNAISRDSMALLPRMNQLDVLNTSIGTVCLCITVYLRIIESPKEIVQFVAKILIVECGKYIKMLIYH